jgi:uncharacterized protein (DUF1499 family)
MKKQIQVFLTGLLVITGCSGTVPKLGIENGQLAQCPASPNCVNSQAKDQKHFIEPIQISRTPSEARNHIMKIVKEMNRSKIITAEDNYIRAEFSSKVFGFVDDVEFYFPDTTSTKTIIHVRSASRVGYSDLGVNRKRIEQIRNRLKSIDNTQDRAEE